MRLRFFHSGIHSTLDAHSFQAWKTPALVMPIWPLLHRHPPVDIHCEKTLNLHIMNSITNLTSKQLRQAANLKDKIESLEKRIGKLLGSPSKPVAEVKPKKRRKMSAAGRARIAAAARARWAKLKGKETSVKPVKKAKRKMSNAARAKISALAKARWAKAKAAGKTKL
jgi:hypothetical protein